MGFRGRGRHPSLRQLDHDGHPQYLTHARHTAVDHDGLPIEHAGLDGIGPDDHHARDHAARHASGGDDSLAASYLEVGRVRSAIVSTGAVPAAGAVVVTVTWPTPLASANYVPKVSLVEGSSGATPTLRIGRIVTKTAAAITVRVENQDALTARTGELQAEATHLT